MSARVITLVAPFLDRIEAQLDADFARVARHIAEQSRWEAEMDEPLLALLEEHARCFGRPDKGAHMELA